MTLCTGNLYKMCLFSCLCTSCQYHHVVRGPQAVGTRSIGGGGFIVGTKERNLHVVSRTVRTQRTLPMRTACCTLSIVCPMILTYLTYLRSAMGLQTLQRCTEPPTVGIAGGGVRRCRKQAVPFTTN